jgi:serine/threonine protein phosphatase PrpC
MEDAHIIDCFMGDPSDEQDTTATATATATNSKSNSSSSSSSNSLADHTFLCILDGHAGANTALYVSSKMTDIITNTPAYQEYKNLYLNNKKRYEYEIINKNKNKNESKTSKSKSKSKSSSSENSKKNNKKSVSTASEDEDEDEAVYENTEEELDLLAKALCQAFIAADDELRQIDIDIENDAETSASAGGDDDDDDDDDEYDGESMIGISGSTCVCTVITPSHVICANVGDSRAVIGTSSSSSSSSLSSSSTGTGTGTEIDNENEVPTSISISTSQAIALSDDHKPENIDELNRITNSGLFVVNNRVNGELAMSRALGDFQYKLHINPKTNKKITIMEQAVTCIPDIAIHKRSINDKVLVLACDGIWDVISNDECIQFLTDIVMKTDNFVSSDEAADALISLALTLNSTDNISAIVCNFKPRTKTNNGSEKDTHSSSLDGSLSDSDSDSHSDSHSDSGENTDDDDDEAKFQPALKKQKK